MESYRHPEAEHSHACESSRAFAPGLFSRVPLFALTHCRAKLPRSGHAMRTESPLPGTVVGKALEPLEEGVGVIKVLVMLR